MRFEKANKEACLAFITDEISIVKLLKQEDVKIGPMFADFILKYSLLSEFITHYELVINYQKALHFQYTSVDVDRNYRKNIDYVFFYTMHYLYKDRLSYPVKKLAFVHPDLFGRRSILKLISKYSKTI